MYMKNEDGECTFHFNISTYYADIYFQKAVVMYKYADGKYYYPNPLSY